MAAFRSKFNPIIRCKNAYLRCKSTQCQTISQLLLEKPINEQRNIKGWVTSARKMKDVLFADLNDGSCSEHIQVVIPKQLKPPGLSPGTSLSVTGSLGENVKGQAELSATEVTLIGESNQSNKEYPFSAKQKHAHDYCRQYLHLRPKLSHFQSLLRLRHKATLAVHNFFDSQGFVNVHTPILTCNDCEGAGEVFKVLPVSQQLITSMKKKGQAEEDAFFGEPGFLSVSGQLQLEAISRSFCKVYSFSPTFRAENSKSRLHLSEFYMIESEEAFVNDLTSILQTMESFVKHLITSLLVQCKRDLEVIVNYDGESTSEHLKKLEKIAAKDFVTISFKEACDVVERHRTLFKSVNCEREGFTKEQELFLVEFAGTTPVFVVDWPKSLKPFYMKAASSSNLVSAVDLLVPNVGELCGGSLREDNLEVLQTKLEALNLVDNLQWYLDLRRYGNVPTGGFGMGFERFLQLITGLSNIKDTIPFPRWPHSLKM